MIQLWQDLTKIIGQLRGSRNLFGYKSTVANQLYLLYYFGGKLYFARKLGQHSSFLWYCVISSQILFVLVTGFYYSVWYDPRDDLLLMLNIANAIGTVFMSAVIFPAITIWFGDRFEKVIEHVDNIFASDLTPAGFDCKQTRIMADAKKSLSWFLIPFVTNAATHLTVCVFDIVLFFQPDKPTNYLYYPFPPPMIRRYTELGDFIVVDIYVSWVLTVFLTQIWLAFGFILYWNVICCDELAGIRDYIRDATRALNAISDQGEFSTGWDETFERTLQRAVKKYQHIASLINYLRGFVETIGSMLIIAAFVYGVPSLHVTLSNDLSWVLKVKCMTGYLDSAVAVFLFYTIGQNLDNSISEVSLVVYSTPWYQSTKHRKHVHILLCQTRSTKSFAVFRLYGLLYNNFSRYLHGIVSYTNMLRRLTVTKK